MDDGATGHLVPPGDVDALAARLDSLCADGAATLAMGSHSHERAAERFGLDAFANRFDSIYHDICR